jgi:E3 ubiquitin-protein ligase TRIP12
MIFSGAYVNFIKFVNSMKCDERKEFLKFMTGSPRLPLGGFKSLDPKMTVVLRTSGKSPDYYLPSVMT